MRIRSVLTLNLATAKGAQTLKSASGCALIYADEGNHWDVTYYNCGGC
ncbi:hypothetical protein [Streptomyces flavidovirens]